MQTNLNSNSTQNNVHMIMRDTDTLDHEFKEIRLQRKIVQNLSKYLTHTKQKIHNLLSYENTKNMNDKDISEYFSSKSNAEKSHIKFMISVSSNFSKNDIVNKAIFEEVRNITEINERIEFSFGLALEKENFLLGFPSLHDVLILSDEWVEYSEAGGLNGAKEGVFMNEQHKARYERGKAIKYNEVLLSQEEATDFIITMFNLAKENFENPQDSIFEEEYKDAFQRYGRIYKRYLQFLLS